MSNTTGSRPIDKTTRRLWHSTMAHPLPVVLVAVAGLVAILFSYLIEPYFNASSVLAASPAPVITGDETGTIRIGEVMTGNRSAYFTTEGKAADWLEIVNTGSAAASLKGYTLYSASDAATYFTFPDAVIRPGECVLVFCDKGDSMAGEYHAPFNLPSAGTTLVLTDGAGNVAQSLPVPEMDKNRSYSRADDGSYAVTDSYTPGLPNTAANHATIAAIRAESPVIISEVMAKNATYRAPDGTYPDYIELTNTSSSDISLFGWHLSDSRDNPGKWTFPDVTIPGNGTLIVWCTGQSGQEDGMITSDFMLKADGECAVLATPAGQIASDVDYPSLAGDQAWSILGGQWTNQLPPTPGYLNTYENAAIVDGMFEAGNTSGVTISEIMASTDKARADWVELYNSTGSAIDLSGWGFSDNPSSPMKWTFPAGTAIQPGQYMGLFLSGTDGVADGYLNVSMKLSINGGYTLTLATPDGAIRDRMYVPEQYRNISYGRMPGRSGCWFFTEYTPGTANSATGYASRAQTPVYSTPGGLFRSGETLTVELTVPSGCSVYYTLDAGTPDTGSTLYTGPISISSTTILRTQVYAGDALPSYVDTQSYLFDVSSTVSVISMVSDPDNLFDQNTGIYANYSLATEVAGSIEMFDPATGETLLSQGCGYKLHGDFSRKEKQKAFKVYARAQYGGGSRFDYPLFSDRDYEDYSSFLLRSSGQDTQKTRMRDSVFTSLAEGTSVMYQETEICVVYINGQYWGQYYLREHITTTSICQFEGWEGQEDNIDLIKANSTVFQGSNDTFAKLLDWVNSHNMNTDEAYQVLDSAIDIQNYIEYMAIEIFTGNTDTLNVKRYRNPGADGKWRWVLYDLDWAFTVDTNSIARWIAPGGMGNGNRTNNDLFVACMKNSTFRDRFLTYFGEKMATDFSTEHMLALFEARYRELEPLLPAQLERWSESTGTYKSEMEFIITYARERPAKLFAWTKAALNLSDAQMQQYFGAAMEKAASSQ